jgi:excisionase family DNA binding protein
VNQPLRAQTVFLSKQRAAVYARLSVRTLERAIRAGELEAVQVPGHVRIRLDQLDAWLDHRYDSARLAGRYRA